MEQSTSREEIENRIRNIESEIAELRQANDGVVNFAKIEQLEDELEKFEHELDEMVIEMAQNSGIDFEQAQQNEEEQEKQEPEEMEEQKELQENINNEEEPKPLDYWEYKSGVTILPYEGSRNALSSKGLTREEFIKELATSVAIVVRPGMAEDFFKYRPEEWEKLRNSKEEFQKVIVKYGNDLPVDIDTTQAYVLYQNDEDTIHSAETEVKEDTPKSETIEGKEEDPQVKRNIDIIQKHISSASKGTITVLMAEEAMKLAEKGMIQEEELDNVAETIEKNEEVEQEERQEEHTTQEDDSLGETFVKNVLTNSIDEGEMVDDTMNNSALASVSNQIRDAIENGIENEEMEKEEEEFLPGMNPKI